MHQFNRIFIAAMCCLPLASQALPSTQYVTAPSCLVKKAGLEKNVITQNLDIRLLKLSDADLTKLIQAKQAKSALPCGGFIDVTEEWQVYKTQFKTQTNAGQLFLQNLQSKKSLSDDQEYKVQYADQVKEIIKELNPQNMWDNLTTLTNFQNRNANSDKGVAAAEWISNKIAAYANEYNRKDVTIFKVPTPRYKQPSLVVKIGNSNEPGIVVGGHMDTIVIFNQRQPGADDDGSGTVTILEAARSILKSGTEFKKPLYFVWYAAEEQGLIGSKAVVRHFKAEAIPVAAAIQFDMTGYAYKNEKTIWLLNDNVNKKLTTFVGELAKTFTQQSVELTYCGYGCSDHASWNAAGIPAAAPFEAKFGQENPHIHSTADLMDHLSLEHMADYAKIAVAYAVEMAEPVKS